MVVKTAAPRSITRQYRTRRLLHNKWLLLALPIGWQYYNRVSDQKVKPDSLECPATFTRNMKPQGTSAVGLFDHSTSKASRKQLTSWNKSSRKQQRLATTEWYSIPAPLMFRVATLCKISMLAPHCFPGQPCNIASCKVEASSWSRGTCKGLGTMGLHISP